MITTETNLYASHFPEKQAILPRYSKARNWKDITNDEMKQFIALQVSNGIVNWHLTGIEYDPLLGSPIFNEVMPRNRFQSITEFLHFNDNSNMRSMT